MNSGLKVKDVIVQMPNSFQYQLEGGLCMGRGGGGGAYNQIFCPTRNSVIS